jgi:hypothetical protein
VALSYNQGMNDHPQTLKLPAIIMAGSFLVMLLLGLLTSPIDKVGYAIVFFAGLLGFLISLGYLIIRLQLGGVSKKNRSQIIIVSIFLVIISMFRSAHSLDWVDGLVLLGITSGLLFYSGSRVS